MAHSVLVVEDDRHCRDMLADAVLGAPDLVLAGCAGDFWRGVSLLDDCRPDVLLIDLALPGGHGIDLIRRACDRLWTCESLVLTVFGDDESIITCIRAGASGYLLKDASPLDVAAQIRMLCSGGSPISPQIARRLLARVAQGPAACPSRTACEVNLSQQEHAVLALSVKGYTYEEIASLIGVSRHTVCTYVKRIYRKLQVHSKTEAVYEARKQGLIAD